MSKNEKTIIIGLFILMFLLVPDLLIFIFILLFYVGLFYGLYLLYIRNIKEKITIKSTYRTITRRSYFETFFNKGHYGEYSVYRILEKSPFEKKLFTNLYLPTDNDQFTEIDILMLTQKGVFVVEVKNYGGWIFGNENQRYWTQTLRSNNNNKHTFLNPIWQNYAHIKALENLLNDDSVALHSLIVFTDRSEFKNITIDKFNGRLINQCQLKNILFEIDQMPNRLSYTEIIRIENLLIQYANRSDEFKRDHINSIKSKYSEKEV